MVKNTKCVEEKQNINRRKKIKKEQGIKRSEIFIKLINLPYPCIYKSHAHEVLQIHTHTNKNKINLKTHTNPSISQSSVQVKHKTW